MSEWWTYHLHDFLLFSSRTYDRLFARYNRDVWPLHLIALAAGALILILALRTTPAWRGRAIAIILGAAWLWVAWAFQFKRYATINWAAKWFAVAFVIEAALLIWAGVIRDRFRTNADRPFTRWFGVGLFAFALLIEPLFCKSWATVDVFGITPDPTAIATLGVILFAGERRAFSLLVVPLLWCAISGATWWTLHDATALVLLGTILPAPWRISTSRSTFRMPEESQTGC